MVGGEKISFGYVKFEILVIYLNEDVKQEVRYVNLMVRKEVSDGDKNVCIVSIQMVFKVLRLEEIIQRGDVQCWVFQ